MLEEMQDAGLAVVKMVGRRRHLRNSSRLSHLPLPPSLLDLRNKLSVWIVSRPCFFVRKSNAKLSDCNMPPTPAPTGPAAVVPVVSILFSRLRNVQLLISVNTRSWRPFSMPQHSNRLIYDEASLLPLSFCAKIKSEACAEVVFQIRLGQTPENPRGNSMDPPPHAMGCRC